MKKKTIQKKTFKKTSARIAIVAFLEKQKKPVSLDKIFDSLKKDHIDQSTIYRTVNLFIAEKIARPLFLSKDKLFVELERNDDHHHITCTSCGDIEEIHDCIAEDTIKRITKKQKKFQKVESHTFELFGICKTCSVK